MHASGVRAVLALGPDQWNKRLPKPHAYQVSEVEGTPIEGDTPIEEVPSSRGFRHILWS
jgi:hypothetical protein